MKSLLTTIALIAAFQLAFAQTTVSGTVTSKKEKTPLQGVMVSAKENPQIQTYTDIAGRYLITVPADVKVLVASYPGFTTKTQGIGQKKSVNFELTTKGKSGGKEKSNAKGPDVKGDDDKVDRNVDDRPDAPQKPAKPAKPEKESPGKGNKSK